jgi:hypothetical protein
MVTKTDNHDPRGKLLLRSHFLQKYHSDGQADVLDCCQGSAVMWTTLQQDHVIRSYWGVDLKPKKGRMKIDSVRILQQRGWPQNVVDVDTYGSPWKHWFAILDNLTQPTTVFLTIGSTMFKGSTDSAVLAAIGCTFDHSRISPVFLGKLSEFGTSYCLAKGCDFATIVEAVEAVSSGNARYIGVRLEPKKDGPQVATAGRRTQSVERN